MQVLISMFCNHMITILTNWLNRPFEREKLLKVKKRQNSDKETRTNKSAGALKSGLTASETDTDKSDDDEEDSLALSGFPPLSSRGNAFISLKFFPPPSFPCVAFMSGRTDTLLNATVIWLVFFFLSPKLLSSPRKVLTFLSPFFSHWLRGQKTISAKGKDLQRL